MNRIIVSGSAKFTIDRAGERPQRIAGPKDEPVDDDDMDPREDDPGKLHGPHHERHETDIRETRTGA